MCLSRWYWFVISLILCCGAGMYYILRTPRVYQRGASIVIKDDTFGGTSGGDVGSSFAGIGFLQANTNVLNELASISSPTIIMEAAKRLGLDVSYSTPGLLHDRTLYGPNLPVEISFPDLDDKTSGALKAVITPEGTITLKDFIDKEGPMDTDVEISGRYDRRDTLSTPLGRVAVAPGAKYIGDPLEKPMEIKVKHSTLVNVANTYGERMITESPDEYGTVITLDITDVSPARAEDLLQTIIDVYNENWIEDKNRIAVSTSAFIQERLAVIEHELGDVDADISTFKSEHGVPDVDMAAQLYFNRATNTDDEITELDNRLSMANYMHDYLDNSANALKVLPANSGIENLNIETQITAYNTRLLERNNLVENSSTENPIVVDMDTQLEGMRHAIMQSIDNYIVTLRKQISTARSSKATESSRLQASPSQAKYLLSVERQQKVKESLYLYLLQKREENELSQAFTAYNTRLITPPMGDDKPVSPNRRNVMLISALLGLLIPLGCIYAHEVMNTSVRGRKDIEGLTVPFVGEIPLGYRPRRGLRRLRKAHPDEQDRRIIMVRHGACDTINEAFRVIRTNLELMTDGSATGGHVIMLTSANPGSGKTFISINLATVLAIKGYRVAVVDLDLRKGSVSTFAGSPSLGISSYLSGHAALSDITVHEINGVENLNLIPAGTLPPNPAEMLYSSRLETLIEKLRGEYDYILLDCPPVEIVADAKIINKHADMTLFVIRSGILERDMLPHIQSFYDTGRYRNMAIVLNGTDTSHLGTLRSTYGYGYGYGYQPKKNNSDKN